MKLNDFPQMVVLSGVLSAGFLLIGAFLSLVDKADDYWAGDETKPKPTNQKGERHGLRDWIKLWWNVSWVILIIFWVILIWAADS